MDQKTNILLTKHANAVKQPSKLIALLALIIAFALPFILVKSFPQKHHVTNKVGNTVVTEKILPSHIPTIMAHFAAPKQPALLDQQEHESVLASKNKIPINTPVNTPAKKISLTQEGWNTITAQRGDSLYTVFKRLGLSPQILQNIVHNNPYTKILSNIKTGQQLKIFIRNHNLEQMHLPYTNTHYLEVKRNGRYYNSKLQAYDITKKNNFFTAKVQGSLYATAKRNNIPDKLMRQMAEIFTWEINLAKNVHPGDQFSIIYQASYVKDKLVGAGDILAVQYKTRSKVYQAVRHINKNGYADYYSPQGVSLKKAFDRYPIHFSHVSSSFSLSRYHPILHYRRAHKGIDLAAPIGTPIRATADGRIEVIGRHSGYGNMIKINHNKTYSTIYGHMLRFQKGLSRGSFVRRGQTIGYVGQTGLASGPHCHYEFHINKQPKNPATIGLPNGFPIPAQEMLAFKTNLATLLAQLKLFEASRLAQG